MEIGKHFEYVDAFLVFSFFFLLILRQEEMLQQPLHIAVNNFCNVYAA